MDGQQASGFRLQPAVHDDRLAESGYFRGGHSYDPLSTLPPFNEIVPQPGEHHLQAYTYSDPTLSLWQSAAAATTWTQGTLEESVQAQNVFMIPVDAAAAEGTTEAPTTELESIAVVGDCAMIGRRPLGHPRSVPWRPLFGTAVPSYREKL
jgi:hypothetical protein